MLLLLLTTGSAYSTTGLFGGSQDQRPLVYDGATCTGSETTLTSCTLADYATVNPTCTTIAGVMCAGLLYIIIIYYYLFFLSSTSLQQRQALHALNGMLD